MIDADHNEPTLDAMSAADLLTQVREQLAAAGAPADVLAVLDDPGTPEETLQRLVDAGVLQLESDPAASMIGFWEPLLEQGIDQLEAELAGVQFLSAVRAALPDDVDLPEAVGEMVTTAEEHGGAEALAMLRVLSVTGPDDLRADATTAGDRVAATGINDQPWVKDLGAPTAGTCFGYVDDARTQQAMAATFRYGGKDHAVCVLIDHDLGGGIKDCWVTDEVDQVRDGYQEFASSQGGMSFHEYQPDEAYAILSAALAEAPCPEQPDQIEDVADHIDLVRRRTALLATAG